KIWDSEWKEERAASYGIGSNELEEHYRKRTLLNVNIIPEDIAETIAFIASSKSSKTTGCMIPVDGGVVAAFTRYSSWTLLYFYLINFNKSTIIFHLI